MEHLIPLFFLIYMIGVVVSAVMKKSRADLERSRRSAHEPPPIPLEPVEPMPAKKESETPPTGSDPEWDFPLPWELPFPDPIEPDWLPSSEPAPVESTAAESASTQPVAAEPAPQPVAVHVADNDGLSGLDGDDWAEFADDDWSLLWARKPDDASVLDERASLESAESMGQRMRAARLSRAAWREAVIMSELIAPPRAWRPYRVFVRHR